MFGQYFFFLLWICFVPTLKNCLKRKPNRCRGHASLFDWCFQSVYHVRVQGDAVCASTNQKRGGASISRYHRDDALFGLMSVYTRSTFSAHSFGNLKKKKKSPPRSWIEDYQPRCCPVCEVSVSSSAAELLARNVSQRCCCCRNSMLSTICQLTLGRNQDINVLYSCDC